MANNHKCFATNSKGKRCGRKVTNKMYCYSHRNRCVICGNDCNEMSQTCGHCARELIFVNPQDVNFLS